MDKRSGGLQIFFDAEKDADSMPTMWVIIILKIWISVRKVNRFWLVFSVASSLDHFMDQFQEIEVDSEIPQPGILD